MSPRRAVRHDARVARRRHRGEGSVYYSKTDRAWIARVSLGIVNGKRIGKKVRAATEDLAKASLEDLRRTYRLGASPIHQTLDEYLRAWLAGNRRVRESTLRSYREHVDMHISPLLGGIPVAKLRPSDVERLIADRLRATSRHGRPLNPNTVAKIVTTLRIALNRGVKRGELAVNVASMVDMPRAELPRIHAMTETEADAIVDACRDHWLGPVIRLLAGSGLRLGEAVGLNQGDVLPGFVRLRVSKTTLRAVPITEDAQEALAEAVRAAPRVGQDEPLFFGPRPNRQGHRERLRGDSVSQAFPRVLEAAGLPRLTPHGVRHMAATIMVTRGASMRVIADQLGHKNPAMTAKVYAHVVPEAQRAAVALLNRRSKA
jgi:integrase